METTPSAVVVDSTGSFSANITIPNNAEPGSHTISASDNEGNSASAMFIVQESASITLDPDTAHRGAEVTVGGSGFNPNSPITIKFATNMIGTSPSSITTNADGEFTATIIIPDLSPGSYTISVTVGTETVSSIFDVTGQAADIIDIVEVSVVDTEGNEVSEVSPGMDVLIESEVENKLSVNQPFAYIVQIKDSDGITVSLSWIAGTLPPNERLSVAQSWSVESEGEYTVEIFVWESVDNPVVFAPMLTTTISV